MDRYRRVLRAVLEAALGDVEHRLAFSRLCQTNHHLSGTDDLPRIGPYSGNDPVRVGFEVCVTEVLAGLGLPGAHRVELGLRSLECLQRLIIRDLSGVAILQQFALAVFLGLAPRYLGLSLDNLGLGDFKLLSVLLRIKARQELVLLNLGPDIDGPFEDLAVDPKAEIGLVARLDFAGQRYLLPSFLQLHR